MNKTSSSIIEFKDSIIGNTWEISDPNYQLIEKIKKDYLLDEIIIRILLNRNISEDEINGFLDQSLKNNMPDPNILMDMEKATFRIGNAILNNEIIGIIGDYDVDGIVSSSILYTFLSRFNKDVIVKIPDRIKDGYGPNKKIIKELEDKDVTLIITVDCGANSSEIINNNSSIDFIILDHHQVNESSSKFFAHVNPNRVDDLSGMGYLAASGVVFLTLVSINRFLRQSNFFKKMDIKEFDLLTFLPLVSLATVADVVPQLGLNRSFVGQGLKLFNKYMNIGINAINKLNNKDDQVSYSDLGYFIGPRINAGGRIGKSDLGFKLLTTDKTQLAEEVAEELDKLNSERKFLEDKSIEEAVVMYENSSKNNSLIILESNNWHLGVIGLISSRITNRYQKPSFIISSQNKEDIYTGSARSVGDFNIGKLVEEAISLGLLISGGGHKMAAGFKIYADKFEEFRVFLFNQNKSINNSNKILKVDGLLMASAVNIDFIKKIQNLGPYGNSFEEPLFIFPSHKIKNLIILKNQHLKFIIQDENNYKLDAISFRSLDLPLGKFLIENSYKKINFLGRLSLNTWGTNTKPQLIIDDVSII
ncbi:MAG: single-stranded-DNA-specific exonuclease RecJ [Hyphomicrobiales bacterium]|nr:single-stranded-DNA-specific exonuclease RecJ [Hyphomicrobiales bacterium]